MGPGCRSAGSAEAQGRGRRRPQLEAASKPAKPQAAGVRPAAKMACAVSRRPAWPPWAFCAAFSRPFPHRGGQQLPGLPGGAQRGRRHRHPPPPLWSASLQTGRAPSSGSWGLREVLLAGDSPRLQSSGARPWCWRFPAACGGRPEAGEGEARRRQSPGVCPGRPAWPGDSASVSPQWCHPPPAAGAGSHFRPRAGPDRCEALDGGGAWFPGGGRAAGGYAKSHR